MHQALSALSGLVFLGAFVPYTLAILRGETRPSKASWIIWASLDYITLGAMWAAGSVNGMMIGVVTGTSVVIVLALLKGESGWTKLDIFCLLGAATGVLLWQLSDNALFGILVSQAVILLGSVPTFRSAARHPERENRFAWTLYWMACVLGVFAIPKWTVAHAAQPVNFLIVESVMMYLLYRPRSHSS